MKPYKVGGTLTDNVIEYGLGGFNLESWSKYVKESANIINVKSDKKDRGLHPTQKPVNLMKALIELTTLEGQTVLDPFCGSGTTLAAANELNRKFIGIEKDKSYYDIACQRLVFNKIKAKGDRQDA